MARLGRASHLKDDSGVAMVTVIGVLAMMTIAALAAYWLSQQSVLETKNTSSTMKAFQAANAGVDVALNQVQAGVSVSTISDTIDGCSYVATITQPAGFANYVCESTGTDPQTGITQTIKVGFYNLNLWNMQISSEHSVSQPNGAAVRGVTGISGPVYSRGDLALTGSSDIIGGPIFVYGGVLNASDNKGALVGREELPVDLYVTEGYSVNSKCYIRSVSYSVPNIVLPSVDLAYLTRAHDDAATESVDNKLGTSTTSIQETSIDGNQNTYSHTRAPGASSYYKCIGSVGGSAPGLVIDRNTASWGLAQSTEHDDFAYDATTGTLFVEGTVFIDGNFTTSVPIQYVGNGKIVVTGNIQLSAQFRPSVWAAAYTMDSGHCIGFVSAGDITVTGTGAGSSFDTLPDFAGAYFAEKRFVLDQHPLVKGSVLAETIEFGNGNSGKLVTQPDLSELLPAGMPASGHNFLYKGNWIRK